MLRPWRAVRAELPVGPLFCVIDGHTQGRAWSAAAVRTELRQLAAKAGVRRRFALHQLRHELALELAREGVPLNIIQRQLGQANLGTTSIYLHHERERQPRALRSAAQPATVAFSVEPSQRPSVDRAMSSISARPASTARR